MEQYGLCKQSTTVSSAIKLGPGFVAYNFPLDQNNYLPDLKYFFGFC